MSSESQSTYLYDLANTYRTKAKEIGFDFETYPSAEAILKGISSSKAHEMISTLVNHGTARWPWRVTSKQSVVAEFSFDCAVARGWKEIPERRSWQIDAILTYTESHVELQSDFRPLVFTENPGGGAKREPVDIEEAREKFRKQVSGVRDKVNAKLRGYWAEEDKEPEPEDEDEEPLPEPEPIPEPPGEPSEPEPEPEPGDSNNASEQIPTTFEAFWTRYIQVRDYSIAHDIGGHKLDNLERRPYKAAVGMVFQGIPNEAIFWAMCMHWPESNRRDLGIDEYDIHSFKPEKRVDGLAPEFPYIAALRDERIWPWLISDAGIGKTHTFEATATYYGQPWAIIPLNLGTSPSVFNGRPRLNNTSLMVEFLDAMGKQDEERMTKLAKRAQEDGDVAISEFTRLFKNGGDILLDEIDRAIEGILMMLNAPLANNVFINTAEGKTYEKHPDTIFWAASNTMGMGLGPSSREYRAANALDFATIDRFRMGRIKMKADINDYRRDFEDMVLARLS